MYQIALIMLGILRISIPIQLNIRRRQLICLITALNIIARLHQLLCPIPTLNIMMGITLVQHKGVFNEVAISKKVTHQASLGNKKMMIMHKKLIRERETVSAVVSLTILGYSLIISRFEVSILAFMSINYGSMDNYMYNQPRNSEVLIIQDNHLPVCTRSKG
mmetsp:Transcript_22771/g.49314  ORF Transcript_22771/g.49314 Transcript_22771/m.49314 type:complete len:162 (-) Transcript_22771:96-581(-)